MLASRGYGQLIRDDGPTTHHTKRGTPTMGGLVIVLASVLGYFLATLVTGNTPSASALLLLFLFVGLGTVGFLDDYIKISRQRSLGLRSRAKFIGQTFVALVFGWLALSPWLEDDREQTPAGHAISFIRDPQNFTLPMIVLVLFIWLLIAGASNAVNLTDGLDGLAAGASVMTFGAYTIVNIWQNNQWCGRRSAGPSATRCATRSTSRSSPPRSPAPASASCGGTPRRPRSSWATPARSPSAARSPGFAVLTRTEFLLVLLGGLFVIQTLSVILQVGFFKLTKGRRLFRMAPLHHHFEMLGLGGDHRRDPVLDDRRHLRGRRAGGLLRRVGRRSMRRCSTASAATSDWSGVRVVVAGFGVSGYAAADNLTFLGAQVTALDESEAGDRRERAALLESLGATIRLGAGATAELPDDVDLVVTSPGWSPAAPAAGAGRRARRPDLGRGRAGLAAARPGARRRPGWRSPAPTARPRPCRCSRRCCAPAGCARSPAATSGCRSSRR